jgi:organic radical activating enzyme
MVKITEIFASQQFEGKDSGKSTIFIRFENCNMRPRCKWCDVDGYKAKEYTIQQIVKEIKKYSNIKHITFTGGSPALYSTEINQIKNKLSSSYKYDVETNGILISLNPSEFETFMCSPKRQLVNIDAISHYVRFKNVYFKFVIEDKSDDYTYWSNVIKMYHIPKDRVYMMPEGRDRETIRKNTIKLSKLCIRDGYNLSTRVQYLLYGKKRRV